MGFKEGLLSFAKGFGGEIARSVLSEKDLARLENRKKIKQLKSEQYDRRVEWDKTAKTLVAQLRSEWISHIDNKWSQFFNSENDDPNLDSRMLYDDAKNALEKINKIPGFDPYDGMKPFHEVLASLTINCNGDIRTSSEIEELYKKIYTKIVDGCPF